MNKADLTKIFSTEFGVPLAKSTEMITFVLGTCYDTAKSGERVRVDRHKFACQDRAPRKGRNPLTGEIMHIPGRTVVVYKNSGE